MAHHYHEIAFTDPVKAVQRTQGSRAAYGAREAGVTTGDRLGPREIEFIRQRDSFYLASVSQTGWPYLQHRGGPPGFVHVLDEKTLGFADFSGNRQYVTIGNLSGDRRVSLFFMDYANRRRLKLFGRANVTASNASDLLARFAVPGYRARVERAFLVRVEAVDWNCSKFITPRFTDAEIAERTVA